MDERFTLSERAGVVLRLLRDREPADASAVVAEIVRLGPNPGSALARRLRLPGADGVPGAGAGRARTFALRADVLAEAAGEEAARAGSTLAGCEHLVLALVRLSDGVFGPVSLARAEWLAAVGEAAGAAYERLPVTGRAGGQQAIVLCGLPGTGKSTLADLVAARLGAPSFCLDWFLGTLTPFGVVNADNGGPLGNHMLTSALARQLSIGQSAVLDAGGFSQRERSRWRSVAGHFGVRFVGVECVCPDEAEHRRRVEARSRAIPGWPATVTWEHVGRMRERWEPWEEPHLVIDTLGPAEAAADQIVAAALR